MSWEVIPMTSFLEAYPMCNSCGISGGILFPGFTAGSCCNPCCTGSGSVGGVTDSNSGSGCTCTSGPNGAGCTCNSGTVAGTTDTNTGCGGCGCRWRCGCGCGSCCGGCNSCG